MTCFLVVSWFYDESFPCLYWELLFQFKADSDVFWKPSDIVNFASFMSLNCQGRAGFGDPLHHWRGQVCGLYFSFADLVFYHVLIVSVILSNQAFTGNIVEKPASQKTEEATSQVCVSLYEELASWCDIHLHPSNCAVIQWIPILIEWPMRKLYGHLKSYAKISALDNRTKNMSKSEIRQCIVDAAIKLLLFLEFNRRLKSFVPSR